MDHLPPLNKEMLEVTPLTDLVVILESLKQAALWLQKKQINYWQNWLNPETLYIQWIEEGLKEKQFFEVKYNQLWLGMFRLQWSDEMFWGKQDIPAAYIHSFTTNRRLSGQRIGSLIMDWITDYCRQSGKEYLRLDCGSHITGLCKYYQDLGFELKGEITLFDEVLSLFQKKL